MKNNPEVSFQEKVEKCTDILMKWDACAMSWEYFMINCAGWSSVPTHIKGKRRSLLYREYVEFRLRLSYAINTELENRGDCRRITAWKDDNKKHIVKWMSKSEAIPHVLMKQFKRITDTNAKTVKRCDRFLAAKNIEKDQIESIRKVKRNTERNHMKGSVKLVAAMTMQPTKAKEVKHLLPEKGLLK